MKKIFRLYKVYKSILADKSNKVPRTKNHTTINNPNFVNDDKNQKINFNNKYDKNNLLPMINEDIKSEEIQIKKNKLNYTYDNYNQNEYNKTINLSYNPDSNIGINPLMKMIGTKKIFNWLGIPTKYDEINTYAKWWKFYDNLITINNLLIVILAFYDYELNFSYPRKIVAEYSSIRLIMISLALTSIFCVFKRHHYKQKWRNVKISNKTNLGVLNNSANRYELDSSYYSKNSTEQEEEYLDDNIQDYFLADDRLTIGGKESKFFSLRLVMDLLINLIMPYPGLDFIITINELNRDTNQIEEVQYLLSDFIYLILILRLIFLIRAAINYSIFSDSYAMMISKNHKVSNNIRFAIKCLLKTQHIKLVMLFFCAGVVIFGFMLRIFDRPFWVQKGSIEFDSFFVPMWTIFVTMLTIGYGDYYPITFLGKIIVYVGALWGVFICSLIIVCLQGLLDLSNDQFTVFTKILKSRTAMKFIESAYLMHRKKLKATNLKEFKLKYSYLRVDMMQNYFEFKNMRNESKSIYRSNGLLHYNMKMIKEMKKIHQRIDKFELMIDDAKKRI